MLIIQEHSVNEHLFGRQAIRFAVSNIYSELFLTNSLAPEGTIFTDVFIFEKHKSDLEMEDGKFGIDELTFAINSLSCKTEADKQAMYFCLDATSVNTVRYCALFFGNEPTTDNMMFVGKINTKIAGEDIAWRSGIYSPNIKPERIYKLSALSFDVSILDECSINDDVYNLESVRIDNIRERFFDETHFNTWFKSVALHRLAYQEWGNSERYIHYSPLINLKTYLDKMLSLSSSLLQEKFGIEIAFTLAESDLGIDVLPSYISERGTSPINNYMTTFRADKWLPYSRRIRLQLAESRTSTTSPLFISQTLIDSRLINNKYKVGEDGIIDFLQGNAETMDMSFMTKLKTMSELLFTLARDLGCFLILGYSAVDEISIEFIPRESIVNDGYTYLIDVEESNFDSSSNRDSGGGTNFYALSSNELDEGRDVRRNGVYASWYVPPYQKKLEEIKELKEQKNIDSKKLMLSISPSLTELLKSGTESTAYDTVPMNTVAREITNLESWNSANYEGIYLGKEGQPVHFPIQIHTGIYVKTDRMEVTSPQQPTNIYRTAHAIVATVNGMDKVYYKLGDYINDIYKTGQEYYDTELNLRVPYWNGFNDIESATGASWKKLTLGSVFKFSEIVKRFTSTEFTEIDIDRDYVVVGIERDLSKPETSIKLIDKSAYAFGYPAEIPEIIPPIEPETAVDNEHITNNELGKRGYAIVDIEPPEEILIGEAVMILSNGTVAKAKASSSYPGADLGIALESGISKQIIMVQTGGIVDLPGTYNFSGHITKKLFLRTNTVGSNVMLNPLLAKTETEDLYCILGTIESETSFLLRPKSWKFA